MSGFLGIGTPRVVLGMHYGANEDVLQPVAYRLTMPGTRFGRRQNTEALWPRSSFTGQSDYANWPPIWESQHQAWELDVAPRGTHSSARITGFARDATGAVLAGATVQLFNTVTGLLVETATADAGGFYELHDPNNVACFVVAYKAGSPDVFGTTVNTLVGA